MIVTPERNRRNRQDALTVVVFMAVASGSWDGSSLPCWSFWGCVRLCSGGCDGGVFDG